MAAIAAHSLQQQPPQEALDASESVRTSDTAAPAETVAVTSSASNESETWLAALDDPLANLQVVPGCLAMEDLEKDQNWRLVVADQADGVNMKLKVIKVSGQAMLTICSLCSQYSC